MTQRLYAVLARMDSRLLLSAMVLLLVLSAFEGWFLMLRKPYGEYQRLKTSATSLAAALHSGTGKQDDLNRLEADLKQLSDRMQSELRPPSTDAETVTFLMTELDRVAARHGVLLTGIRPGSRRQLAGLEELSFDVGAQGKYLALCAWLLELRDALGPSAAVTDFEMKSIDDGQKVALTLKLALYGPVQKAGARQ